MIHDRTSWKMEQRWVGVETSRDASVAEGRRFPPTATAGPSEPCGWGTATSQAGLLEDIVSRQRKCSFVYISFFYPPHLESAALRAHGMARHLSELGWNPLVVTPGAIRSSPKDAQMTSDIPGFPVVRTHHVDPKPVGLGGSRSTNAPPRFLRLLKSCLPFSYTGVPDYAALWIPFAVYSALQLRREHEPKLVFSTFGPAAAHFVGYAVAEALRLPWVAEFRDLWAGNPYVTKGRIWRAIDQHLERWLVRRATTLVGATPQICSELEKRYAKECHLVTNGFEEADCQVAANSGTELRLCYTGSLYRGVRDPRPLLKAVRTLESEGYSVSVDFYGPGGEVVNEESARLGVTGVTWHGPCSHSEAIKFQSQSDALLVIERLDKSSSGIYTAKVFEYMAIGRPILGLVPVASDLAELLEETGCGTVADTVEDIIRILRQWCEEKRAYGQIISNYSPKAKRLCYSRKRQAERLAEVFSQTVASWNRD